MRRRRVTSPVPIAAAPNPQQHQWIPTAFPSSHPAPRRSPEGNAPSPLRRLVRPLHGIDTIFMRRAPHTRLITGTNQLARPTAALARHERPRTSHFPDAHHETERMRDLLVGWQMIIERNVTADIRRSQLQRTVGQARPQRSPSTIPAAAWRPLQRLRRGCAAILYRR